MAGAQTKIIWNGRGRSTSACMTGERLGCQRHMTGLYPVGCGNRT